MPSMANITIKNAAGTDVTATALTPSAGDNVAARWRVETSLAPAFRPTFSAVSRQSNGSSDIRRVQINMAFPVTYEDAMTSTRQVSSVIRGSVELIVPQTANTSTVDDAVAYLQTFLNNALTGSVLKSQIAPT